MNTKEIRKIFHLLDLYKGIYPEFYKYKKDIAKTFSLEDLKYFLENIIQENNLIGESVKHFCSLYKKNKKLAINLYVLRGMQFDFNKTELERLIGFYGEDLLTNFTEDILKIDRRMFDYQSFDLKKYIEYAKKDLNQFKKFISIYKSNVDIRKIISKLENKVDLDLIFKRVDVIQKLQSIFSMDLKLTSEEYSKLLKLNEEKTLELLNCYNKISSVYDNISSSSLSTYLNGDNNLLVYLLKNPLDDVMTFLSNTFNKISKKENAVFFLEDFFASNTDIDSMMKIIDNYMNMNINIQTIKELIQILIFKAGAAPSLTSNLVINKWLNNSNTEYSFEIKKYLDLYNKLEMLQTKEEIKNFLTHDLTNFNIIDSKRLKLEIVKIYNHRLREKLLNPENLTKNPNANVAVRYIPFSYLDDEGKLQVRQIKVINIKRIPFATLMTMVGYKSEASSSSYESHEFSKKLVEHPEEWTTNPAFGTNYISMSLNTDRYYKIFTEGVALGFCRLKDDQIRVTCCRDNETSLQPGATVSAQPDTYQTVEELTSRSGGLDPGDNANYNEIVSNRDGVIPDYIMTSTVPNNSRISLTSDINSLKWAAYYGKPIIEIDCESYYRSAVERLNLELEKTKNNPLVPTVEDLRKLQVLMYETETFHIGFPTIDNYTLIMTAIDMSNREWSVENIRRLDDIINNTFNKDEVYFHVGTEKRLNEKTNLIEENRLSIVNQLKKIVETKKKQISEILGNEPEIETENIVRK